VRRALLAAAVGGFALILAPLLAFAAVDAAPVTAPAAAAGGGCPPGSDQVGCPGNPVSSDTRRRIGIALAAARSQLGRPYVWGGGDAQGPTGGLDNVTPPGYDCSGLMVYAWARAGIALPHSSRGQYHAGTRIPITHAGPGDLVFLATDTADPTTIHHVAMIHSPGHIIEAQTFGVPVHIRPLATATQRGLMPQAVRLFPQPAAVYARNRRPERPRRPCNGLRAGARGRRATDVACGHPAGLCLAVRRQGHRRAPCGGR
jgi:cell wall-associated NlpC family hydrolase